MDNKVGFVAEVTKGLSQKAEVAAPEGLVRADGEVGVEKDFQASSEVISVTRRAKKFISTKKGARA